MTCRSTFLTMTFILALLVVILYLNNTPKNSFVAVILFCTSIGIIILDICICLCIPDIAKEAICKKTI